MRSRVLFASARRLVITAVITASGIVAVYGADGKQIWKPILNDAELNTMVAADAKIIADTVAKGAPDKKAIAKIRAAALMIATYAQGAGDTQAGLRDLALKIGKAATDGKVDEIKTLVTELKPGASSTGAKTGVVALQEQFELAELMQQFKPEGGGGISLERNLQTLINKRAAFTPAEYKAMIPLLLRTAVIAQPCEAFAPAKDEGTKTKEQWNKWSQEMAELASEGAKLAKTPKPDDKAVKNILKKLEANCTNCHKVFRDAN
jgi:cytochrome c556